MLISVTCIGTSTKIFTNVTVSAATTYTYGKYKYTVSNKKATITKYTGTASTVTLPSKLGGYTVTAIGKKAFRNNTTLKTLVLSSSVTTIGGCIPIF